VSDQMNVSYLPKAFLWFIVSVLAVFLIVEQKPAYASHDARMAVLSEGDVTRYQDIFALQEAGNIKLAAQIIPELDNPILLGHVLSQKYLHPTAWRSSYKELSNWLSHFNDHPAASRISWLAKKRKPASAKAPKAPKQGYLNGAAPNQSHCRKSPPLYQKPCANRWQ